MNHIISLVSTHSRPKAAGHEVSNLRFSMMVSTHSRPKAAGLARHVWPSQIWRFNTQPPEGGWIKNCSNAMRLSWFQHTAARRRLVIRNKRHTQTNKFQHTAARRRLDPDMRGSATEPMFQHTAARRRLGGSVGQQLASREVSTHSRPKAAGSISARTCSST